MKFVRLRWTDVGEGVVFGDIGYLERTGEPYDYAVYTMKGLHVGWIDEVDLGNPCVCEECEPPSLLHKLL